MIRTLPKWPLWMVGALFLFGALAVGAWNVRLPYFAFSQGPVGNALEALGVDGVDVYPPGGELLMLTVTSQGVNPYEALIAALDPDVDLVPEAWVRPPQETNHEYVARNLASMDLSKDAAIAVALQKLGYSLDFVSDGVRIVSLVEASPAASLLRLDDVIEEVGGTPVRFSEDVSATISSRNIGDVIEVAVSRDGVRQTFEIELIAHLNNPERPMIGITAETINPRMAPPPFPIDITSGRIGGPSAGMMYTLALIDVLSPGDLTQGHVIAGTGTMDPQGRVGPIGGVRQKVVGAEAAGAEIILVPSANYQEALTARTQGIRIVGVGTIDDALTFLQSLPAS
jgi:Lon-like protease